MKKEHLSSNEIAINMRRFFTIKPCTIAFKSKKQYNRKDKSWKKYE